MLSSTYFYIAIFLFLFSASIFSQEPNAVSNPVENPSSDSTTPASESSISVKKLVLNKEDMASDLYIKAVMSLDEMGYEAMATQIALKFPSDPASQNFLASSEFKKRFAQISVRDMTQYRRSSDKKPVVLDGPRLIYLIWLLSNLQNRMKEPTLAEVLHRIIRQNWDDEAAKHVQKAQAKLYAWYEKYNQTQGVVFAQIFSGKGEDLIHNLIQAKDGGYVMVGETDSKTQGRRDILWLKHDRYGKRLWDQNVGGQAIDSANALVQTQDGGYAIVGTTWSSGQGRSDVWLLKTNAQGKIEWNKTFGGIRTDEGVDIALLPDQGFLILARIQSNEAIEPEPTLIKTDSQGKVIWQQRIECNDENQPQRLHLVDNNEAVLVVNVKKDDHWGIWLIKVNAKGEKIWEQYYHGDRDDRASDMAVLNDGILILASSTSSFGKGRQNVWLIKTDGEGQKILEKVIGSGEDYNYPTAVAVTADQNWVITGYTSNFGSSKNSAWLVKFDTKAKIVWNKSLRDGKPKSIILCQDQGFSIAGEIASEENGTDIFLIKSDPNGKFE